MLRRSKTPQHEALAKKAATEVAPSGGVGKFLGVVEEESNIVSYRFEAKIRGYEAWEWNVVVFQGKKSSPATVSEIVMLPGKDSIVAPPWLPWSERRAEPDQSLASDSAVSDLVVAEEAEGDPEDAGQSPPRREGLLKRLIQKKDGKKSKKPRKRSK